MFWFIVLMVADPHGTLDRGNALNGHFPSYNECMAEAAKRAAGIRRSNLHGKYICMHPREPTSEMKRHPVGEF